MRSSAWGASASSWSTKPTQGVVAAANSVFVAAATPRLRLCRRMRTLGRDAFRSSQARVDRAVEPSSLRISSAAPGRWDRTDPRSAFRYDGGVFQVGTMSVTNGAGSGVGSASRAASATMWLKKRVCSRRVRQAAASMAREDATPQPRSVEVKADLAWRDIREPNPPTIPTRIRSLARRPGAGAASMEAFARQGNPGIPCASPDLGFGPKSERKAPPTGHLVYRAPANSVSSSYAAHERNGSSASASADVGCGSDGRSGDEQCSAGGETSRRGECRLWTFRAVIDCGVLPDCGGSCAASASACADGAGVGGGGSGPGGERSGAQVADRSRGRGEAARGPAVSGDHGVEGRLRSRCSRWPQRRTGCGWSIRSRGRPRSFHSTRRRRCRRGWRCLLHGGSAGQVSIQTPSAFAGSGLRSSVIAGRLAHVLVASLFVQLFALATPIFFQLVVDKVLVHKGMSTLVVLVLGMVTLGLFEAMLQFLRAYTLSHTTNRIDVELGRRLFHHLFRLPLAYFETRAAGQTVARMRELETIRSFLTGQGLTSLLDLVFTLVFIGVMFIYSVKLTLVVLISIPVYVLIAALLAADPARADQREVQSRGALAAVSGRVDRRRADTEGGERRADDAGAMGGAARLLLSEVLRRRRSPARSGRT